MRTDENKDLLLVKGCSDHIPLEEQMKDSWVEARKMNH